MTPEEAELEKALDKIDHDIHSDIVSEKKFDPNEIGPRKVSPSLMETLLTLDAAEERHLTLQAQYCRMSPGVVRAMRHFLHRERRRHCADHRARRYTVGGPLWKRPLRRLFG